MLRDAEHHIRRGLDGALHHADRVSERGFAVIAVRHPVELVLTGSHHAVHRVHGLLAGHVSRRVPAHAVRYDVEADGVVEEDASSLYDRRRPTSLSPAPYTRTWKGSRPAKASARVVRARREFYFHGPRANEMASSRVQTASAPRVAPPMPMPITDRLSPPTRTRLTPLVLTLAASPGLPRSPPPSPRLPQPRRRTSRRRARGDRVAATGRGGLDPHRARERLRVRGDRYRLGRDERARRALRSGRPAVHLGDGRVVGADVLAVDRRHDLAVLALRMPRGQRAPAPLPLGGSRHDPRRSDRARLRQPFGLDGTLTQGIVSARGTCRGSAVVTCAGSFRPTPRSTLEFRRAAGQRARRGHRREHGDPLTHGRQPRHRLRGPVNYVSALLAEVSDRGARAAAPPQAQVEPPTPGEASPSAWLGIYGADLPSGQGVVVQRVVPGSPAARAGLLGAADPAPLFVRQMGLRWGGYVILAVTADGSAACGSWWRTSGPSSPGTASGSTSWSAGAQCTGRPWSSWASRRPRIDRTRVETRARQKCTVSGVAGPEPAILPPACSDVS